MKTNLVLCNFSTNEQLIMVKISRRYFFQIVLKPKSSSFKIVLKVTCKNSRITRFNELTVATPKENKVTPYFVQFKSRNTCVSVFR